ncbi:hypothetical protein BDN72DRAFT_904976 [Pluteus cervinus]|uniref:Uncharacterized protein n=1 Tax=Pluteus cervinus TaxID=181527 RepID=A0ACD3A3M1_9AGAR|nr:hypothetical protein BDN72DRAFT_904976 [Pluteus cervinus]
MSSASHTIVIKVRRGPLFNCPRETAMQHPLWVYPCPGPVKQDHRGRNSYRVGAIVGKVDTNLYVVRWWRWPPSADTIERIRLTPAQENHWKSPEGVWYYRPGPYCYDSNGDPRYVIDKIIKWAPDSGRSFIQWDRWPTTQNSWEYYTPTPEQIATAAIALPGEVPEHNGPIGPIGEDDWPVDDESGISDGVAGETGEVDVGEVGRFKAVEGEGRDDCVGGIRGGEFGDDVA